MRTIDLSNWLRRKHFEVFSAFGYLHINLCANVEITAFYSFVKQRSLSLNVTPSGGIPRRCMLISNDRRVC